MTETCEYCEEPIEPGRRVPVGQPLHRECVLRMVSGSLAHHQKRCGCYIPGSSESDPPGMTRHQAALAVWEFLLAKFKGRRYEISDLISTCGRN